MSLRDDIEQERISLDISLDDFSEVKHYAYKEILDKVWCHFTKLGYKAENHFLINHHLEGDAVHFQPESEDQVTKILSEILPNDQKIWFIGQETNNERPKYWLYESTIKHAQKILDEMYLFDFYIVSKKYQWLVTEEHHGVVIAVGDPVASNLKNYKQAKG